MIYPNNLPDVLEGLKIRPAELANRLGESNQYIYNYTSGKRKIHFRLAERICEVLSDVSGGTLRPSHIYNDPNTNPFNKDEQIIDRYNRAPEGIKESIDILLGIHDNPSSQYKPSPTIKDSSSMTLHEKKRPAFEHKPDKPNGE